jgi:ankyrin repeat protein
LLLYTQALSNLLPGALLSNSSSTQPVLAIKDDLEPIAEHIDELHRLGASGLAKCLQESLVMTVALNGISPLRLRLEADKLNRLDLEFSSSTSDDLDDFGLTYVPLLLRAQMLNDHRIIGAVMNQYEKEADESDAMGRTALHVALDHMHLSNWTPTNYSGWYNRTENECKVVQALLNWGVPITAQDIFRRSALHIACFEDFDDKVIQLLVDHPGIDIEVQDANGRTAFSWAVKKRNVTTVRLLLATGKVNVNHKDKIGRTPLSFAVEAGDVNMVKILLARDDIDSSIKERGEMSSLAYALGIWNMEIFMALMERGGIEVNSKFLLFDDLAPIHNLLTTAASRGIIAAVRFLLGLDEVDIETEDDWGMTACDWARKKGHEDVVKLFEEHALHVAPSRTESHLGDASV